MYDFHVSDLATQTIPNSKYYWHNEKTKSCILLTDSSRENPDNPVAIHFMQLAPEVRVLCDNTSNPDVASVEATPGMIKTAIKTIPRVRGKCVRPENAGKIMNAIFDLIDANSWSFPRATSNVPYMIKEQAILLEQNFKSMVESCDSGDCIFAAVSKAGTLLAERIGIKPEIIFQVSHYDMKTNTQDDELINVQVNGDVLHKSLIIIDDLISSGRTCKAVIDFALSHGAAKVIYLALYRTICSREVDLPTAENVLIQSYAPLSNAYWTYGRGFDLTDDESRSLPDIYAATKHWDWETSEDIDAVIDFFGGAYHVQDYEIGG